MNNADLYNFSMAKFLADKSPIEKDLIGVELFHSPNPDNGLCDACDMNFPCPVIRISDELRRIMKDSERLDKLFKILPFEIRHKFGGDETEFREGIDAVSENYKIDGICKCNGSCSCKK